MDFESAKEPTAEGFKIPFGDACAGFVVTLRFLSKPKMREIAKSCKTVEYQNHQQSFSLDDEKLAAKIAEATIVDWEGLTPKNLKTLVPEIDIKKIEEQLNGETVIACDAAAKKFLVESSYQFSAFVDHFIMDDAALREAELKN